MDAIALVFLGTTLALACLALLQRRTIREQRENINEFEAIGARLVSEMEKVRKNNDHYLKFAEDVIRERDRAITLYQAFGHSTSVAQNWLLRDLRAALREANGYRAKEGKAPLEVNPELTQLVEEYPESVEARFPKPPAPELPEGLPVPGQSVQSG